MDSNSISNQNCYKWGNSHNFKDSDASPADNLKHLQFHIGITGQMTDIHTKVPLHPSAFLTLGTSKTVIQWNITTSSGSCMRGTSSPPHTRWCHTEVEGFVYMTHWPCINMRKLVVSFWTLKSLLFPFYLCTVCIVN